VFVGRCVTSDGMKFIGMVRSGSDVSMGEVRGWHRYELKYNLLHEYMTRLLAVLQACPSLVKSELMPRCCEDCSRQ
jgi:hypothetical protein